MWTELKSAMVNAKRFRNGTKHIVKIGRKYRKERISKDNWIIENEMHTVVNFMEKEREEDE